MVLGSGEHSVLDDRFCLIDINGKMVEEPEFLNKIKQSIQSFQELTVVCANQSVTQHLSSRAKVLG